MGYFISLSKATNEHWLNASELTLLVCGLVLAYGATGEYLEEHGKLPKWMRWAREPKLVFVWMVAISLIGEFAGDAGVYIFSGQLQTISDSELTQLKNENLKLQGQVTDAAKAVVKAQGAADAASKSAGEAQAKAGAANLSAADAQGKVAGVRAKANALSDQIDEETQRLKATMPRSVALMDSESDLNKLASKFPRQKIGLQVCGEDPRIGVRYPMQPSIDREAEERSDVVQALAITLVGNQNRVAERHDFWPKCDSRFRYGIMVFRNADAPSDTANAAKELSDKLSTILPSQRNVPFLVNCGRFTPPPAYFDEDAPCASIRRDSGLLIVLVGQMPVPLGYRKANKPTNIHPK